MLLPHGTIVALVDGNKFELLRNSGNLTEPALTSVEPPMLDGHNKGSGGRHISTARNPDDSLLEEDAHAAAVTEWLNGQTISNKIDNLVIIAAPKTLGEMRRHYHKQLKDKLICELPKDLAGKSGPEIIVALNGR